MHDFLCSFNIKTLWNCFHIETWKLGEPSSMFSGLLSLKLGSRTNCLLVLFWWEVYLTCVCLQLRFSSVSFLVTVVKYPDKTNFNKRKGLFPLTVHQSGLSRAGCPSKRSIKQLVHQQPENSEDCCHSAHFLLKSHSSNPAHVMVPPVVKVGFPPHWT